MSEHAYDATRRIGSSGAPAVAGGRWPRRPPIRHVVGPLVAAGLAVSCASAGPYTVSWPADRTTAVSHGDWIQSWPQAVSSIAEVMHGPLGLPPVEFTVHFFHNRRAFEQGLVDEGYPPAFARRTAAVLDGIGGPGRVLLNEAAVARAGWSDRVALLAHELVHVLQYELGGGHRGTSEQWLREGFAEWVSGRVLEGLRMAGAEREIRRARRVVALAGPTRLPPLSDMVTFDQWVDLRTARPMLPTYEYAFVAADFLVDRHGVDAVLDYFRRFATSSDTDGNFAAAFGESRRQFEQALVASLTRR
jgi:hypothetical protein